MKELTVLFIDDEELMRDVATLMFEDIGWKAHVASSGKEGLELFETLKDEIDICILDFSMPEMNGVETSNEIIKIKEDAKIVIISGLISDEELDSFRHKTKVGFMSKPFLYEDLIDCIEKTFPEVTE